MKTKKTGPALWFFFGLTFLLTWLIWLPALLNRTFGAQFPVSADALLQAGTFVPSAAGFLAAGVFGGRKETAAMLRSMVNVYGVRLKWVLFAFLALPAASGAAVLIFRAAGGILPNSAFPLRIAPAAFFYILVLMGPLGEEAGWRGFALKRLLGRLSPFRAAVVLGLLWALWHGPLFFIEGTTQHKLTSYGLLPALGCFVLYTGMLSLLMTLLYMNSGGSILGAMVFHAMANLCLGAAPLIFDAAGAFVLLLCFGLLGAVCMHRFRRQMFSRLPAGRRAGRA